MKTISKLLTAAFILALGNNAFGQANTNASASATIVAPISIQKTENLQFGSAAAGTGGTVIIDPDGSRSKSGNVTLVNIGDVSAAAFTVEGDAGREYVLTLPTDPIVITLAGGGDDMSIDGFASSLTGRGTLSGSLSTTGTTGTQDITVGATLHVKSGQTPGAYSGTFNVSVNYY